MLKYTNSMFIYDKNIFYFANLSIFTEVFTKIEVRDYRIIDEGASTGCLDKRP